MYKTHLLTVATVALFVVAPKAAAQCVTVDPVIIPQVRIDPLDASGAGALVQPFYLTFRRAAMHDDPIRIRYQIVDDDSAAIARIGLFQGPTVEWTSVGASRDIGALRHESYSLLRTGVVVLDRGELAAQSQAAIRLSDLRADLPAGVYREQFSVRFWCEAEETAVAYEANGAVAASAAVPNVLSANVAGASSRGEIDFLNFETLTRSLQVSVRSTGPFRVTARSGNSGVMLRDGARADAAPSDRIHYQASFDGEALSVRGGRDQIMPRAGLGGRQFPLDVQVSDVSANRAGAYADTLYLILEPAN